MIMNLRRLLGRTRLAANFLLGRQAMDRGVTSFDDDVWLVSYPKSGNTWTRFLIANLIANGETVDWTNIERRVPDIYINADPALKRIPRPRYMKSHEPYRPSYRRVVLIVRDPRDVAVSYYHYFQKMKRLESGDSIDAFVAEFVAGRTDKYGSWGENVGSWLGARRGTPDFMIVRYEDLLEDAETELRRIAEMLRLSASNGQIQHAIENGRADRMREMEKSQQSQHKNLKTSRPDIAFVRAARSGQWQQELPAGAIQSIESAWSDLMRELRYLD
jgi:hypothetical protein